jgi:tyrosyl-tRNA synthetase
MKSVDEQLALIRRGVEQIVPEAELRQKLDRSVKTGKPLRVKYGIDPTGIDVHLGHTVPLRKLRLFQELGHQAVLIIGNYTALVGDPSGKDEVRARLTPEQVEANARDYLKQVSKVIDIEKTEVTKNGDWFSKFRFLDVLALTTKITMQRILERDDFTKRRQAGTPIYLHECLYPLMQGRDSVEIRADIELGGSEQLFSLMVGRDLQRDAGQEPQVCLTLPILRGLDGQRRMGKSLGNYIGVGESAYDQFAKVMSIPDDLMKEWFELLTDRASDEILHLIADSPMQAKKTLGQDIANFYHGAAASKEAQAEWERRFSERQDPGDIPEVTIPAAELASGKIWICKLLVLAGLAKSNNEARRLIEGGGVTIGPEKQKVSDANLSILFADGLILRVGKRNVVRLRGAAQAEVRALHRTALPVKERLKEFFKRLQAAPPSNSAIEALDSLRFYLEQVEDEFSGVPKNPNPGLKYEGRMYPPKEDFILANPDGSLIALTRGHIIEIGKNGRIEIKSKVTKVTVFSKPGGGKP